MPPVWERGGDPGSHSSPLPPQSGDGPGEAQRHPGTYHEGDPGTPGNKNEGAAHPRDNWRQQTRPHNHLPDERTILLVDVSCPFEGAPKALEEAATAKLQKYEPLRQELLQRYSEVEMLPFIVGAVGSWYLPNDRVLSRLRIGWRYVALMRRLCVVSAISGLQGIWIWYKSMCAQRRAPWQAEDTATGGATNVGTSAEDQGATNAAPPQSETPATTRGDAGEPTDCHLSC